MASEPAHYYQDCEDEACEMFGCRAYKSGRSRGYDEGWDDGYAKGYQDGYAAGWSAGYQAGYSAGQATAGGKS